MVWKILQIMQQITLPSELSYSKYFLARQENFCTFTNLGSISQILIAEVKMPNTKVSYFQFYAQKWWLYCQNCCFNAEILYAKYQDDNYYRLQNSFIYHSHLPTRSQNLGGCLQQFFKEEFVFPKMCFDYCHKLIQLFKVSCIIAGQYCTSNLWSVNVIQLRRRVLFSFEIIKKIQKKKIYMGH